MWLLSWLLGSRIESKPNGEDIKSARDEIQNALLREAEARTELIERAIEEKQQAKRLRDVAENALRTVAGLDKSVTGLERKNAERAN